MRIKRILTTLFVLAVTGTSGLVLAANKHSAPELLGPGAYWAKVTALTCEACGPRVKQTLEDVGALEKVFVDQKNSSVQFTVKEGSSIKLSELQKKLKDSSEEMGMGADYRLKKLKKIG